VTLQLPRFAEATAIAAECAYLNFLEVVSWTGFLSLAVGTRTSLGREERE